MSEEVIEESQKSKYVPKWIKKTYKEIKEKKWAKVVSTIISIGSFIYFIVSIGLIKAIWNFAKADIFTFLAGLLFFVVLIAALYGAISRQINKLERIDNLTDEMKKFSAPLGEIKNIVEDVDKTSLELLKTSCSILSEAVNLNINPEIIEREKILCMEGLEAVKRNYGTWSSHINYAKDDVTITRIWLNYLKTYFREEAFDIQRKELATNAHNYPLLLIETLLAFLSSLDEGASKVYFYTVTPVHPKDWFNWPHGRSKPRHYYENLFIGRYRRILKHILRWDKNSKICHGRFLLTVEEKDVAKKFGWEPDLYNKVLGNNPGESHLNNWKIIDIPATFSQFSRYGEIQKIFQYFTENDSNRLFIPLLYSESGKYADVKKIDSSLNLEILKNQIDEVTKKVDWKSSSILSGQVENDKKELERIIGCSKERKTKNAYEKVKSYLDKHDDNEFPIFIENMQLLSVLEFNNHETIDRLLINTLRIQDFDSENNWSNLKTKYINDLHSKDGIAATITLHKNGNGIFSSDYWGKNNIPNEFALFGFLKSNIVDWKVAVMTDLDYPFKVTGIRLLTKNESDGKRKDEFARLLSVINGFIEEKYGQNKSDIRNV